MARRAYFGKELITLTNIKEGVERFPGEDLIIAIDNTRYQSPDVLEAIAKVYPNVTFSVIGGLDPQKEKFNNPYYQRRTYYSGQELAAIIRTFEKIEREIDLAWSETQKCMFVYKCLCEHLTYSGCIDDKKDHARCLSGILYNKAVCSGIAMIFKEAMDRLGIECIYQNRESHYSWNIVKLDGEYRTLELTFDVYDKTDKGCGFVYFGRDDKFYQSKHHDLSLEPEEKEYPVKAITDAELIANYKVIRNRRFLNLPIDKTTLESPEIKVGGEPLVFTIQNGILRLKSDMPSKMNFKSFQRADGTSFILFATNVIVDNVHKFWLFELVDDHIEASKIFSENNLLSIGPSYDAIIANSLLGKTRLMKKLNSFNGYVGYIDINRDIKYDREFEKTHVNVKR